MLASVFLGSRPDQQCADYGSVGGADFSLASVHPARTMDCSLPRHRRRLAAAPACYSNVCRSACEY